MNGSQCFEALPFFTLVKVNCMEGSFFFSCKEVVEMLFAPHDHVVRNKLSGWRMVQLILILRKML